jgi:hypothetical protein
MNYAETVAYECGDSSCAPKWRGGLEGLGSGDLSSGINVFAGGVTYVDFDYERTDAALRSPAYCEARDFIFGLAEADTICIYARSPWGAARLGETSGCGNLNRNRRF